MPAAVWPAVVLKRGAKPRAFTATEEFAVDRVAFACRAVDEQTVEVATSVQDAQIVVRLVFNEAGDIAQTIAERPRLEAGNATTTWIGEYADYQQVNGQRLPTRGEVRWELPDGPFVYWRATISSLDLDP